MIVRYIGPFSDSSGYSVAARGNVVAMVRAGIDLTLKQVSFENQYTNHGEMGQLIQSYTDRTGYWDINIIHLTPENWHNFIQPGKYNIGYTVWETSLLPTSWVPIINRVNEVWVPSQWNKLVFLDSGVTIPIKVVPHALPEQPRIVEMEALNDDTFKFYSIFQWTVRKNPIGLLTAYLTEFTSDEKVTLYLKTYHMGWTEKQQSLIRNQVRELKNRLGLKSYPNIQFIGNLLSDDDICRLHQIGDCCVLPHKGEGFGLVPATAMLYGKPVISTNWGGNLQFMNNTNSYLADYEPVHVEGMPWDKYESRQLWAEPNINHVRQLMRFVFTHQDEAKATGLRGQIDVQNTLSYSVIGRTIRGLLHGKV